MSDHRYMLVGELDYAFKGNMEKAQFIDLSMPSAKFLTNLAPIRCEVMKAIQWSQEQNSVTQQSSTQDSESEEDSGLDPVAMITTLELAKGVDIVKVLLNVKAIIISKGMAKIDGEINLNNSVYDKMSLKDIYGITGKFIVDFTIPSL
jgi:hypothetical protein